MTSYNNGGSEFGNHYVFFSSHYTLGLNPTKFQTNWVHGLGVITISSWEGVVGTTPVLWSQKIPSLGRVKIVLIKMVTILMMSAKMPNPGLLKIKVFWNKGYDVMS